MLDKLIYISGLFKKYSSDIYIEDLKFYIKNSDETLKDEIRSKDIEFDEEHDRLLLKLQHNCFTHLVPYKELQLFEIEYLESSFIILDDNGDYCYYYSGLESQFNQESGESFKNTCKNLISYYTLFTAIISTEFADHYNALKNEIVLFSSVNGIFKIDFESIPIITDKYQITNSVTDLIKTIESIELKQFVKNSFFTFSNGTGKITLNYIFENAEDIISTSKRDYELVSKQFNFKEFKNSLYAEKEKYFSDIREIINKIFSQAVGIPISISATVFVTYKISDDNAILLLVLFSFFVYVSFYIKIQLLYKSDLNEIRKNFRRDFEIIKTDSGLDDETIGNEKTKIENKINNSISIVNWLLTSVIILGLILTLFVFYQIYKVEKASLFNFLNFLFFKFNILNYFNLNFLLVLVQYSL